MEQSQSEIAGILASYGVKARPEVCRAIREYVDLLVKWNQRVSLTSIRDPAAIVGRHFAESLFAIEAVPLRCDRLADVGSGAGFPGLALKLALPDTEVILIEANARKAAFLAEILQALRLRSVRIVRERTEQMKLEGPIADCVTSRATGQFKGVLRWSARALDVDGIIVLWVGEGNVSAIRSIEGWSWRAPIPIPKSERRVLLVGRAA